MKKVCFCLRMPRGTYVGGVATVINGYLEHQDIFNKCGYETVLFDYVMPAWGSKFPSKIEQVLYGIFQERAIDKYLTNNNVDVVNIHTSREWLFFKDVNLAKHIDRKFKKKVVVTVHVGAVDTVFNRIKLFESSLLKIMNTNLAKSVFLSQEMQEDFIALGIDKQRTEVLYNPHNMLPMENAEKLGRTANLHLLFVGALHREKGILELLEALCHLKNIDFHIDICGLNTDDYIRDDLDRYKECLGSKVTFHGYVQGSKKTALFERADVLLLPSYHEGMPLVVLEALASSCAIVSTRVGTTPEILTEDNVLWVDVKSSKDIEEAVKKLNSDRGYMEKMKAMNLKLSEKFSVGKHIEELCRIYDDVL